MLRSNNAGVQAIGDAARLIRDGEADIAVCGGAEAAIDRVSLAGFAAARAMSGGYNDTPTPGGLEAIFTVLAVRDQRVPATLNDTCRTKRWGIGHRA